MKLRGKFHRDLVVEHLESRLCMTVFYDLDVVAQAGVGPLNLTSIGRGASINDHGQIAFTATRQSLALNAAVDNVFGFDPMTGAPMPLMEAQYEQPNSGPVPVQTFGQSVQLNNSGQVAVRRTLQAYGFNALAGQVVVPLTYMESWPVYGGLPIQTAMATGSPLASTFTIITNPSYAELYPSSVDRNSPFRLIYGESSINDAGQVVFTGQHDSGAVLFTGPHATGSRYLGTSISTGVRPQAMLANTGAFVLSNATPGQVGTGRTIGVFPKYDFSAPLQVIANSSTGFSAVSSYPAISDDGQVIAFAGQSTVYGEGVFISVFDSGSNAYGAPVKIAGGNDGLGFDDMGNRISFASFDYTQRVNVLHTAAGVPGIEGDSIVVAFVATPSSASRDNSAISGTQPLLYSANRGVWTIAITPSRTLAGSGPIVYDNKTSPLPVIQIGDRIDGATVVDLALHDGLAKAENELDGTVRVHKGLNDHLVCFWANTSLGEMIVRGAQFDTDVDGLFDHWETADGGIDIDQDGVVDLNLYELGATPLKRDLFLEIDWLKQDVFTQGVVTHTRNFAPEPEAIQFLVDVFAAAPLTNPDGSTGIDAHVDAGRSFSRNFGRSSQFSDYQGGDKNIVDPNTGDHIHVVYMGQDGSVSFPGMSDQWGRPIVTRSLESIKKAFFGTTSKDARELAFRYSVFAEKIVDLSGSTLGLAESPYFSAVPDPGNASKLLDYRSIPGNDVIIGLDGKIKTPGGFLQVPNPVAGAPTQVAEPKGYVQGQTLVHEIGHTLGLLHGGSDMDTGFPPNPPKPNYLSIMNYAYTSFPAPTGQLVRTFSSVAGQGTFNDWAIVDLSIAKYFDVLGNSLNPGARLGLQDVESFGPEDLGVADLESVHGILEYAPPEQLDGDYNTDGSVDGNDYQVWRSNFGSTLNLAADGNHDGVVNAADYTVWRNNLGAISASQSVVMAPTTSSALLTEYAQPQIVRRQVESSNDRVVVALASPSANRHAIARRPESINWAFVSTERSTDCALDYVRRATTTRLLATPAEAAIDPSSRRQHDAESSDEAFACMTEGNARCQVFSRIGKTFSPAKRSDLRLGI